MGAHAGERRVGRRDSPIVHVARLQFRHLLRPPVAEARLETLDEMHEGRQLDW